MSETVKYRGTILLVPQLENENFEDQCKRLWVLNGKALDDYTKGGLFDEFYNKYLKLKIRGVERVYEYLGLIKSDPDESYCNIVGDENLMGFETVYYNGGADTIEMLQISINKKFSK